MKPRAKASALIWGLILALGASCGDSGASQGGSIATSVTVFVPFDPDDASMEYSATCEPNGSDAVETQGTVERAGGFQLEGEPLTAIFRGSIELGLGPCGIQFRLRDAQGEVIWTLSESFELDTQLSSELYFAMVDFPCPEIPLPDASVTPKRFCGPAGGIMLSAETPAATSSIESVHYVLTSTSDIFLEPLALYEGSLEPAGQGAVDLGGGPIETNLWESIPGVVPVDAPFALEISALDADGIVVCATETRLDVLPTAIAQAHVVLPCPVP
ncbi:MAG: hypothetical protein KJO40_03960 [Deltaproteobacteria bacterium]|nr:hypothetical protein [Deltaproteobacteria bacterium]MBT8465865.1 hypothetical protein [Deltaproteobacteria bacterium]NND30087.1 hypothetical protein [Myxococcales bacterium]NNK07922.1 hypothetical protein [Myxococcales bacterium]RZV53961.1 MAG: hypothetical protein EX268_07690 [Deltaproteobacteria bacterium]